MKPTLTQSRVLNVYLVNILILLYLMIAQEVHAVRVNFEKVFRRMKIKNIRSHRLYGGAIGRCRLKR